MSNFEIRKAQRGDEASIAPVHIKCWQQAYKNLIPDDYLKSLDQELEERVQMWQNILTNPQRWAWTAFADRQLVGFCLFGPPRDPGKENFIELGAIYVLSQYHGKGIGFELLSTGFAFMSSLHYHRAYGWVLENNPSISFYKKTGAQFLGQTKMEETAGQEMKELAYEWTNLRLE